MREKLQTLPLAELKEIAKSQGITGISGMKKGDLIEMLCQKEKEKEKEKESSRPVRSQAAPLNPGVNSAGQAAGQKI